MKVKIVKANKPTYWYNSEIGEIFDVITDGVYYVVNDASGRYIDWNDTLEIKTVNCKIDLSWIKGEAREVISREIQKKLFEAGVKYYYNNRNESEDLTDAFVVVIDNKITTGNEKDIFDAKIDGHTYTKEQLAAIPEVSVNNALKGKFWTYSNTPKKEEAPKPTRCKVSLTPYVGKARVAIAKAVQEEAFKKGFKWNLGKTPMFTGVPYLFFEAVRGWITYGMLESVYNDKNFKELTVEEILSGALPQVK